MAKIQKFGVANSLLDVPMATWLTLTGTLAYTPNIPLMILGLTQGLLKLTETNRWHISDNAHIMMTNQVTNSLVN